MTFVHAFENGLTLLFERRAGPGFAFELRLPVGAAHDPPGLEGTASLLEEWLHKGAMGMSARELADAFDTLGIRRGGSVTHETTRFSATGLTPDLPRALELTFGMLRRPALPDEEFDVLVDLARQDLESLPDSPPDLLTVETRARVFAPPYAHPVSGSLEALERVSAQDARAMHALYGPSGAVLAVVADVLEADVLEAARRVLGGWAGGGGAAPPVVFRGGGYGHLPGDSQQTHLNLVFPGVSPTHPEWFSFHLALGVLSGGSASRLFEEVREQRGLAYSVSANAHVTGGEAFVWAYAGSTPDRAAETLGVLLGEFERLSLGVTEGEFERARAQLLAASVFGAESARGRAGTLARDWLTLGRVRAPHEVRGVLHAATLADVNAFLERHAFCEAFVMTLGPSALMSETGVTRVSA